MILELYTSLEMIWREPIYIFLRKIGILKGVKKG